MTWYIIQTNPQAERKAVEEIRRAGIRAYLPKRAVYRRRRDDKIPIRRWPALVGYVLIRFPSTEDWFRLRQCQGVKGVLYFDGVPYRLAQTEVADIMRAQRAMRYDAPNARAIRKAWLKGERDARRALTADRFKAGARVYSAAANVIARIVEITKHGTVKGMIESRGRDMPVEFTETEALQVLDEQSEAA